MWHVGTEALTEIHGIGLYSALLIVAEIGERERFRTAKQVGAYAGLTCRVHQSGGHCYRGSIQREDCAGGGCPQTGGDLLEAAASLAA
jgi:transposase